MEELGAKQQDSSHGQALSTADFRLQNPAAIVLQEQTGYCSKELLPVVSSTFPSLFVLAVSSGGPRCKWKSPVPAVGDKRHLALVSVF